MEDKVGSKIPSEQEVAKRVEEIDALAAKVAPYTVALTKEQRQAVTKFRRGGDFVVAILGGLVERYGVVLPGISVDAMNADLTLTRRLAPLAPLTEALTRRIADTILEAQSECWWAATAYYTALHRMSASDPELADALAPVVEFFALGRRAAKPEPTPTG
jgi:hypothetical protein